MRTLITGTTRRRWLAIVGLAVLSTGATAVDLGLIDAARNSDAVAVRASLKKGADPSTRQKDGTTALLWAAYRDDVESADALIRAGANASAANDLGATPLWAAALNGSAAMTHKLLEAGANPNTALTLGETVVMTAARSGSADVVEQLLAKGADPNKTAARGQTALMWAVAQQHPDVVKVLLAHGADVRPRSSVWTELRKTDPDQASHPAYRVTVKAGGDTALLFAARSGDLASARLLVAAGANVNDQSASGTSVTALAAHSNHDELVAFLLEHGADPNAAAAGYTALHAAILRRNLAAVTALLDHGADPNAPLRAPTPTRRDSEDFFFHNAFVGATPIWLAARFSQPDVVRLLATHGANPGFVLDVNYPTGSYGTYSHIDEGATSVLMAALGMGGKDITGWAAPNRRDQQALEVEAVKIIADLGVDLSVANAAGDTALRSATAQRLDAVVQYLAQKAANAEPAPPAFKHLSRADVDALLKNPAGVLLLDVRSPDEVQANGGFAAYLSIPSADLEKYLAFIPKGLVIVPVSNHASRAEAAAAILVKHGFKVGGVIGAQTYEADGGTLVKVPRRQAETVQN